MRHLLMAGMLVCVAARAWPQDRPRSDLFAGYSLAREEGASRHGGEISLAYRVSSLLGIVLDLDAHRGRAEGVQHTISGALAGPRLAFRSGGITPFVHLLVGVVREVDSIKVFSQTISESHTRAGAAVGGGLDVGRQRFGGRLQADYRWTRRTGAGNGTEMAGDPRVSAGVVFRMGRR